MKFVHIADMHFDMSFKLLSNTADLGEIRRLDQRKAFKKMIEYIKLNNIPYLFIAGDLYEQEYIRESTIAFINDCFKEIPNTMIYITPGNHDPYLKNSYYNKYNWNENVKIFTAKVEKIVTKDFDLYGYGFEDFYCENSNIENIKLDNPNKINILMAHSDLDGTHDVRNYNAISSSKIKEIGFDYIALGHIHKRKMTDNIIYPGSTISLGFDELGEHGMIVGNIEDGKITTEFIKLDNKEFKEVEIDVSNLETIEELLEKISTIELQENNLYKIILMGNRNFEIDTYKIYKLVNIKNIIKIKDKTKIGYDLKKIANDVTLKGIFAKEMLTRLENTEDKQVLEKAIEIGIEALS